MTTVRSEYSVDDVDGFSFQFRHADDGGLQFVFKTRDGVEVVLPLPLHSHAGFRAALADIAEADANEGNACMEMPITIKVPGSVCRELLEDFDAATRVH